MPSTIAHLIRHAESIANVGLATDSPAAVPLTDRGREQARRLAEFLPRPDLLVTSPYERTKATAAPLLERYPTVRQVEWPVQEFTFLAPGNWVGTTVADRKPAVSEYWQRGDPDYRDGDGAESFNELMVRVDRCLAQLPEAAASRVVLVSHAGFLCALLWRLLAPAACDAGVRMRRVFDFTRGVALPNAAITTCEFDGLRVRVHPVSVAHLETNAGESVGPSGSA